MINKQKHKYSCAPVSIVNALRFKGYCDSYNEVIEFTKNFGYSHEYGMDAFKIQKCLLKLACAGLNHASFIDAFDKNKVRMWNNPTENLWVSTKLLNKKLRTHVLCSDNSKIKPLLLIIS